MDEPWRRYPKWNKPVSKRQIRYDSTYMRYLRTVKFIDTESRWWLSGAGGEGIGELMFNEYKVPAEENEKGQETDGGDGCTTM